MIIVQALGKSMIINEVLVRLHISWCGSSKKDLICLRYPQEYYSSYSGRDPVVNPKPSSPIPWTEHAYRGEVHGHWTLKAKRTQTRFLIRPKP